MPIDEPANQFVIKDQGSDHIFDQELQGRYIPIKLNKNKSSHILQSSEKALEATEIRKIAVNKSEWSQLLSCRRREIPQTKLTSSFNDDDDGTDKKFRKIILEFYNLTQVMFFFVETFFLATFKRNVY